MVRRVVCGHWDRTPRLGALALEGKIEAYNLPQGVITHMYRDIAAHNPATLSKVGLHTFVDPRLEGGKLNGRTKEDLVKLVEVEGQECLLYRCFPMNAVFLRASWADEYGNCTAHREIGPTDLTAMAQACRNSGGKVIVQVEKIVAGGTLDPKLVVIPGIYVDAIVVGSEAEHQQCMDAAYDGSLTGEFRAPADALAPLPLDARKVIARRAAMELRPGAVVNLGVGIPERVARVAAEEGISQEMTLTVEAGSVGGVPRGGTQFGGAANPAAILPQNVQFDFYHGGGLDIACLGMAEIAPGGDVNSAVEQVTFSGDYAVRRGQRVLYVTERAVFALQSGGVTLTEIAPGIDLQTQILDQMAFMPRISEDLKLMDERIFQPGLMGLGRGDF